MKYEIIDTITQALEDAAIRCERAATNGNIDNNSYECGRISGLITALKAMGVEVALDTSTDPFKDDVTRFRFITVNGVDLFRN